LQSEDNSIRLDDEDLLIESLQHSTKKIALIVAEGEVKTAKEYYETWDIDELYEYHTIKLTINYRVPQETQ